MPTILQVFGLRVIIYPNDHGPAHVHVIGRGCEAIFKLNCPDGPVVSRENFGFSPKILGRIAIELTKNLAALCMKWRAIHGNH